VPECGLVESECAAQPLELRGQDFGGPVRGFGRSVVGSGMVGEGFGVVGVTVSLRAAYPPRSSRGLRKRQEGQPSAVVAHAWRAQKRLHKKFEALAYRMAPTKAVVAVARELVGFVWALLHNDPALLQAGISLVEVGRFLGHSSPTVTWRYAHLQPDAGMATAAALGDILRLHDTQRATARGLD